MNNSKTPPTTDPADRYLMQNYNRLPVYFTHGQGSWLYDSAGKRYLDALCGFAVTGLGHAHPDVTTAIITQARQLLHTSNYYHIAVQEQLAEKLTTAAGMERVFLCNSGAEANEAAIKLTRLYAASRGISQPQLAVMSGAFHGRTLATLSATGKKSVQAGFEPLVEGFVRIGYGDIAALAAAASEHPDIVAVMLEPVQGENGITIPPEGYLHAVRQLCNQQQWLLILDEVQTGNGRCGNWFAAQNEGVTADILTTAKGLGNGLPIGACMSSGSVSQLFVPGSHGSTFGGNPLACSAAIAVIDTISRQNLCQRAASLGKMLQTELKSRLQNQALVHEVRGTGLMIAIELNVDCSDLLGLCLSTGLLINMTDSRTIRLLPPLNMSDAEADQLVDILCQLIANHTAH